MRYGFTLLVALVVLAACAQPVVSVPPTVAPDTVSEPLPLERTDVPDEPLTATRGEIRHVTTGWFGAEYSITFLDGVAPLPGAFLSVRRAGRSVGRLVVVESGRGFTVVVGTVRASGKTEFHTLDVPAGPRPRPGSVWRFVDEEGAQREGEVIGVMDRTTHVVRPLWDGSDSLREGDDVIVTGHSEDALQEARRPRWLE